MPEVPECLQHRTFDERRKLPIPFVHDTLQGEWDFTVVLSSRVSECINDMLCGQCGNPLGWWMAFIGGPISATTRVYSDPPMHEECARAALSLCPHINRVSMKRVKAHRLPGPAEHSEFASLERPPAWVMTISRGYQVIIDNNHPLFRSRPFRRMYGFRNTDTGLESISDSELNAVLKATRV